MATVVKEIGMETSRWKRNTNANSVSVSNNLNVNKRETLQREYNNDKNISSIFDRFGRVRIREKFTIIRVSNY